MENYISRRDFIKATGAAALTVACSGLLAGCGGGSSVTSEFKFIPEIELTFPSTWLVTSGTWYQDTFSATANGQKMDIQNGLSWISYTVVNVTQTHKPEFKTTNSSAASSFKEGGTVELTIKINGVKSTFVLTRSGANYNATVKGSSTSTNEASFNGLKVKVKGATFSSSESTT